MSDWTDHKEAQSPTDKSVLPYKYFSRGPPYKAVVDFLSVFTGFSWIIGPVDFYPSLRRDRRFRPSTSQLGFPPAFALRIELLTSHPSKRESCLCTNPLSGNTIPCKSLSGFFASVLVCSQLGGVRLAGRSCPLGISQSRGRWSKKPLVYSSSAKPRWVPEKLNPRYPYPGFLIRLDQISSHSDLPMGGSQRHLFHVLFDHALALLLRDKGDKT